MPSEKTIGRLTLYRRILNGCLSEGVESLHSHQLAERAGAAAAQVRRDLMEIGYAGNSRRGYDVQGLLQSMRAYLDEPGGQGLALIGVGNLGRAILSYFIGRRPHLSIVAAFDTSPQKVNRVVHGCRCYPMEEIESILVEKSISTAILAVPSMEAQRVAEKLVRCSVRGILNFAPRPLHLPPHIYVENIDLTMSLEKVAFFSREGNCSRKD